MCQVWMLTYKAEVRIIKTWWSSNLSFVTLHNGGSTMSDCNVVPFSFLFKNLNWVLESDNGHFDQGLKSQTITSTMIWHCLNVSCRFYTYHEWWPILNSNTQISTFAEGAKITHCFTFLIIMKNRLNFKNDKLNFNGSCLDIQIKVFISYFSCVSLYQTSTCVEFSKVFIIGDSP
jgi:hypothetical protein